MNNRSRPRIREDAYLDCFKEAGRELGCDESEVAFDERIEAIVKRKSVELEQPVK